jgi:hypothetical protein
MSMTTTTTYGFTMQALQALQVPQVPQPPIQPAPGQLMLDALAGLFQALAPMLRGMGSQLNQPARDLGNPFQQAFGLQGLDFKQIFQQVINTRGTAPFGLPVNPFGQQPVFGQRAMTQDRAVQVLKENWEKASKRNNGETISRCSLKDVLSDPNASPELKEAARFLLNNNAAFNNLERADAGRLGKTGEMADGTISRGDLDAALHSIPFTPREQQVAKTLLDNLNVLGNGDQKITQADLAKILATGLLPNGQPASPAMLAAARHVAANPSFFSKLEETFEARNNPSLPGSRKDGVVGVEDLLAALARR